MDIPLFYIAVVLGIIGGIILSKAYEYYIEKTVVCHYCLDDDRKITKNESKKYNGMHKDCMYLE